jgi:O-methyltransferase
VTRVHALKGWDNQTLTVEARRNLSLSTTTLVHIDCDFYESATPCLEFIGEIIRDGTVLVFDDWFRFHNDPDLGVQGATNHWLKRNPQLRLTELARHGAQSVAFIVNCDE